MNPAVEQVRARAFTVPTAAPESDGTIEWSSTTIVVVEALAAGKRGLGWSYAHESAAALAGGKLAKVTQGLDALSPPRANAAMVDAVRNVGRSGIASCAISAVDVALWDLKAKLLELPLYRLLGAVHDEVPIYGSGGFTSETIEELQRQLGGWAEQGIPRVKMKVGRDPSRDLDRVKAARAAIGPGVELFVDANGAYSRKQALRFAEEYDPLGVRWFEEPVSMEDLDGLRLLRDRAPMPIAAGEYAWDPRDFLRLLRSDAVDVLQADATRCGGITGFLQASALCDAFGVPLSSHCAPALHVAPALASRRFVHAEWFADHVRIERLLFDGAPMPVRGALKPDPTRPGHGLSFKWQDAERYAP